MSASEHLAVIRRPQDSLPQVFCNSTFAEYVGRRKKVSSVSMVIIYHASETPAVPVRDMFPLQVQATVEAQKLETQSVASTLKSNV